MRALFALVVALAALTSIYCEANAAPKPKSPPGPALVFDATDGKVIYADNADTPWYPASLTKLMTAYVVFDAIKRGEATPESEIVISRRANAQPKSRAGIGAGKKITVKDALNVLIVHSANDIAVALAEAVAGSEAEFVEEMNQTALRLGMVHTQFVNANGLPQDGQATTARDMGLLARALIRDFPEWNSIYAQLDIAVGTRSYHTHNKLLGVVEGSDGMKTGFTCGAGYNIVASATRNGRRIVAVVLGDRSGTDRTARASQLIEAGFATPAGQVITATALEPEPISGEALLDQPLFSVANNLSMIFQVAKCAGPPPRLKPPPAVDKSNETPAPPKQIKAEK